MSERTLSGHIDDGDEAYGGLDAYRSIPRPPRTPEQLARTRKLVDEAAEQFAQLGAEMRGRK
jgi:hypothetical protein